ncbi:DNA-binding protein [Streptomyces sp. NBC_01003]|nr:DNA-binding protein [Streptomyces sp. NBC_01003]
MMLNAAGRQVLAGLCGVDGTVMARALPSWAHADAAFETKSAAEPVAVWRVGGAVVGPVAFGCRLCAARRSGVPVGWVRYAQRWERVCVRHGRWLLDADAEQELEYLDLRSLPEVALAQRRWAGVARRAVRGGVEPERVFALAYAVVARWWEQALYWEEERVWPGRLHQVAGGDAGGELERWRIVGRDAVIFPEVVAVADALLDPVMAQRVWVDSGAGRSRPLPADGAFCRALGERVGRPWLGPVVATDYGGPLIVWMGAVVRMRRGQNRPDPYAKDSWWVRQELQPASMAAQLRVRAKEEKAPGSGTTWRAAVSAEQRFLITNLLGEAEEQVLLLRGAQVGSTADAARYLLETLSCGTELLDRALVQIMVAAVNAGVGLEEVAGWARLSSDEAVEILGAYRGADGQ